MSMQFIPGNRDTNAEAVAFCEVWMEFPVAALTVETFVRALGLSARFGSRSGMGLLSPLQKA